MANDLRAYSGGSFVSPTEILVYDGAAFDNVSNVYIYLSGVWVEVWPGGSTTSGIPKFKPDYILTGKPPGGASDVIWLANLSTNTWAQFNFTITFDSTNRIWPVNGSYPNFYPSYGETGILFVGEEVGANGKVLNYGNIQSNVVTGGGNITNFDPAFLNTITSVKVNDIAIVGLGGGNITAGKLQGVGNGGLIFYSNNYLPNSFANTSWGGFTVSTGISSDMNGISEHYAVGDDGFVFIYQPYANSYGIPLDVYAVPLPGTEWLKLSPTVTSKDINTVAKLDNTYATTGGEDGQLGIIGYQVVGIYSVWEHVPLTSYTYYSGGLSYNYSYTLNFTKTINKIKNIGPPGGTIWYPLGYDPNYYIQYLNGMAVGNGGEVLIFSKPPTDPRGTGWNVNNPNYVWWKPSTYGSGTGTINNLKDCAQKNRGGFPVNFEMVAVGENSTIIRSNNGGYSWTAVPAPQGYNWTAIENFDGGYYG